MARIINFIKLIKNYFVISFLAVIFLASSWSLLRSGFFRTHDYVHGVRIAEMTRALEDGHFPVIWSENLGFGLGMPLFEFYAPLPFYVGSLFYWLGADLVLSTKLLFLISNVVTLIGAYKLGKEISGVRGGILASAAYTLAPYRAVNLFVRGALSEAWGIMALPWILYGLILVITKKDKVGFFIMTLALIVLMLSHNLTTLMFVPFSVLFACVYLFLGKKNLQDLSKKIIMLGGSYLLAGGVSAFYMLPAFSEKSLTQINTILSGYFHYSQHFLYIRQFVQPNWGFGGSAWGPEDGISFFLGYGQLIALFISILAYLFFAKKNHLFNLKGIRNYLSVKNGEIKLYLYPVLVLLAGASLFMTLLKSQWLWDNLPLLNFIQFPWRFMSVGILFVSLIVAITNKLIPNIVLRFIYFMAIFWIIILGNFYYFRPEKFLDDPSVFYYSDETKISSSMSEILPDFIPLKVSQTGNEIGEIKQNLILPNKTELIIDKTHQKLYSFDLDNDLTVAFPIANFPGWRAELDGQEVSIQTSPQGLISAVVPAGNHSVGIYFGKSNIRQIADLISLFSLLIFLGLLWNHSKEQKNGFFRRIN